MEPPVKLGVIARAEDRGLGIQTWEVCRHLRPERVLIVDMADSNAGFAQHFDRFVGLGSVTVVHHTQMDDPRTVAAWCHGLDVIYSAETFYRWRFCDIARAEGARTVCHLNPEFFKHCADDVNEPEPDAWWVPTPWMQEHPRMPATTLVPMPVPLDRWTDDERYSPTPDRVTIVHPAGYPAALDRNGTRALFAALRLMTEPCNVVLVGQQASLHRPARVASGVSYRSIPGGVRDYWKVPLLGEVVVLPRRYGGLCLPALEAAGAGRALVMTAASPNWWFPAVLTRTTNTEHSLNVGVGELEVAEVAAIDLAQTLDLLVCDPANVDVAREQARAWAAEHSWDALIDEWWTQLAHVAQH